MAAPQTVLPSPARASGSIDSRPASSPNSPDSLKRKRISSGHEGSDSGRNAQDGGARNFAKRACNECRQQKLRCDVAVEPSYQSCSRCKRLKLDCKIDVNFRRVDKRNKTTEMERELIELRKRLAEKDPANSAAPSTTSSSQDPQRLMKDLHQGAADSLLELRHSSVAPVEQTAPPESVTPKRLGDIIVAPETVNDLFRIFFDKYHPLLPVLDPSKSPDHYHETSELLFWAIIAVASRKYQADETLLLGIATPLTKLVWATMADVPQNYHVVKALCLMCTWSLPCKTSSKDMTLMLSGLMQSIALQTGLHRPSRGQEYTRIRLDIKDEDVRDRLQTWAACTVVMQNVSTGLGQPLRSQWDFTLTSLPSPGYNLAPALYRRLQVERFCNKVTRLVYMNKSDPVGLTRDEERPSLIGILSEDYNELEGQLSGLSSPGEMLFLKAGLLHLRLSAFFGPSSSQYYKTELLELYTTANDFLDAALASDEVQYMGQYIMQMLLAAGFTLLKLLNSFFARHVDLDAGRARFNATIRLVRALSVNNNDVPSRIAEVLTQMWRSMGASMRAQAPAADDSLSLKVRARMSLSVVYDSVWRWREQFPARGDGTTAVLLDTAHPTDPDPAVDPALADAVAPLAQVDPTLSSYNDGFGDLNYELFDPLMSMLDNGVGSLYGDASPEALGMNGQMLFPA